MVNKLYTIAELEDILKLSSFTIRKKIREKKLIGYKVGRNYLVREDDLIKYINDLTKGNDTNYNANNTSQNRQNGSTNIDRLNRI